MKKSERHQIKRNDLATVLEQAIVYLDENRRTVALVAAVVVVVGLSSIAMVSWKRSQREKASELLGEVINVNRAGVALSLDSLQQARPGSRTFATVEERHQEVIALADQLIDTYGHSRSATVGLYYKSLALANLGRVEEAVASWDLFLRDYPDDFLTPMARYNLGRLYESNGRPAEAILQYQVLADDARSVFPPEEGLLGIARCQEALGDRQEALRIYQRVVSDFPGSEYQTEARGKIDELS